MKVLVDGLPDDIGGVGTLIMNMVTELSNTTEYIFEFLVHEGSRYIADLSSKGYKYFIIPRITELRKYDACIRDIFLNNQYEFVWVNNTSKINIFLVKYAKKNNSKVIMHSHGVDNEEVGVKRALFSVIEVMNSRKYYSCIDIPLACSKDSANYFYRGDKALRDKAIIINNGISVEKYGFCGDIRLEKRKELGLESDIIALTMVGRLSQVKNHRFAVKLMKHLGNRFKLFLFGDGEEEDNIKDYAKEIGVSDRVVFMGNRSDINLFLNSMDVFLLPSKHEGVPFSIIEAQANGLFCVASKLLSKEFAITDLVRFCDLNSVDEWIEAIQNHNYVYEREKYKEILQNTEYSIARAARVFSGLLDNQ